MRAGLRLKLVLLAIAIVLGTAIEAYIIGNNLIYGDPYTNIGRLIGGSIGWALVITIVLLVIASIVQRGRR